MRPTGKLISKGKDVGMKRALITRASRSSDNMFVWEPEWQNGLRWNSLETNKKDDISATINAGLTKYTHTILHVTRIRVRSSTCGYGVHHHLRSLYVNYAIEFLLHQCSTDNIYIFEDTACRWSLSCRGCRDWHLSIISPTSASSWISVFSI